MKFIKYNSIENVGSKQFVEFKNSIFYDPNSLWLTLEKVNGSNFSILYDPNKGIQIIKKILFRNLFIDELIPAKRTSILDINEKNFYNFQKIFTKYDFKPLVKEILKDMSLNNPKYSYGVSIHGELCGGFYPGMPSLPGVKMIQKEVKYSNDTEFIVFDIRVYDENDNYIFLDYEKVIEYCNNHSIPVLPILYKGTLDECLDWSSKHKEDPSEVWKIFNMPYEVPNNIKEGHVIKPVNTIFKGTFRVAFKDKNDKFKEINTDTSKKAKEKITYTSIMNKLRNNIFLMICIPRFNNVASKYGEYSIKNFGDLMNLMAKDILEELKDDPDMLLLNDKEKAVLEKDTIKLVSSFMGKNKKELFGGE